MAQSNDSGNNQQITFTFNAHPSKSLEMMNYLRQNDNLGDITLKISSEEIRAHKLILAANSDYFQIMFCGNFNESNKSLITINDVDSESVKTIIDFFYTPRIKINYDNVEALLEAADFLLVSDINRMCKSFLQSTLNYSNCLRVQELIDKFNLHDLQEGQNTFYSNLSYNELTHILSYFSGSAEKFYLKKQIIHKWISHDRPNRNRMFLGRLGLCRKY